MEQSLFNLIAECKKKEYGFSSNIESALKLFEREVKKVNDIERKNFKERYHTELSKIKYTLANKNIITNNIRSLIDKIFTKHFEFEKNIPLQTTAIFKKFIKGITYFRDQKDNAKPIYHRLHSCGPYEDTHRLGNLICTKNLTKAEIRRRRKLIERCYIERLIYNEIYKNTILYFPPSGVQDPSQDMGHVFRMDLTQKDFETCFPNIKYKVEVSLPDMIPEKLTITKTKNNKEEIYEYTKSYTIVEFGNKKYDPITVCMKTIDNKKYIKISSFDNQGKFKPS